MKYLNEFFNLNQTQDQAQVFDIKSVYKTNKVEKTSGVLNEFNSMEYFENEKIDENGRNLANKYSLIRQGYFEKAAEAHSRGWGAVAQYYADMGHYQTKMIEYSNQKAVVQIFKENNPDYKNSNTLDLHGLHVKEAISVLKDVISQKKTGLFFLNNIYSKTKYFIDLANSNGKKIKSYIFVITGCGHHSENGPRLRPNIINFLNQTNVRYKEVNIGLLQVYLNT